MQTRTFVFATLAALLLVGAATAQNASTDVQASDERTEVRAHATTANDRPAPEQAPTFAIDARPHYQRGPAGETLTYEIVLKARQDTKVALNVGRTSDSVRFAIEPKELAIPANGTAHAKLLVQLPPDRESRASLVVYAVAMDRAERHATTVAAYGVFVKPTPDRPHDRPNDVRPAERPNDTARPADVRPAERPDVAPNAPGFRMALFPERTAIGPDGGRSLVLLQGGDHDMRIQLGTRYNESTGWNVSLDEVVFLPAHGKTWAWIEFKPAETRALKYQVMAKGPNGHAVAEGLAFVEGAAHIS